jgi:hypothetical protein
LKISLFQNIFGESNEDIETCSARNSKNIFSKFSEEANLRAIPEVSRNFAEYCHRERKGKEDFEVDFIS